MHSATQTGKCQVERQEAPSPTISVAADQGTPGSMRRRTAIGRLMLDVEQVDLCRAAW